MPNRIAKKQSELRTRGPLRLARLGSTRCHSGADRPVELRDSRSNVSPRPARGGFTHVRRGAAGGLHHPRRRTRGSRGIAADNVASTSPALEVFKVALATPPRGRGTRTRHHGVLRDTVAGRRPGGVHRLPRPAPAPGPGQGLRAGPARVRPRLSSRLRARLSAVRAAQVREAEVPELPRVAAHGAVREAARAAAVAQDEEDEEHAAAHHRLGGSSKYFSPLFQPLFAQRQFRGLSEPPSRVMTSR